MDNDQIQQTNLVSDDAAAAMNDAVNTQTVQPDIAPVTTEPVDNVVQQPLDPAPVGESSEPAPVAEPGSVSEPPATGTSSVDLSELDEIKKSALDELQPLIEHVEQSPEERYETVMMMIRSNDDPSLVSQAYEAAKGIENEKIRANALLNIVSEIEYLKSKQSN